MQAMAEIMSASFRWGFLIRILTSRPLLCEITTNVIVSVTFNYPASIQDTAAAWPQQLDFQTVYECSIHLQTPASKNTLIYENPLQHGVSNLKKYLLSTKAPLVLCLTLLCYLLGSCSTQEKVKSKGAGIAPTATEQTVLQSPSAAATSEIPDKREFPVDTSFKPCQDFYQYACSKVNSTFKLREDRSYHDFAFSDSSERLLLAKKNFLKDLAKRSTAQAQVGFSALSPRSSDLQKIYGACMNEDSSKAEELKLVARVVSETEAIKTREEFQKFLADKIISEDEGFLDFDSIANLDNPDFNDVVIIAGLQQLPERSYYDKPEVMSDFKNIATDLFKIIGKSNPEARAEMALAFEKSFAQTFPLPAEFRELFNSRTQIKREALLKDFTHFKLENLLTQIPQKTLIRNITPANFAFLNKALETEDLETLKDVYLFHALPEYMDDAYPDFFKKRFTFSNKHLGGPPVRADRQERCTKEIMGSYAKEIDAELLTKLFPNFPAKRVVRLAEIIRHSIISGLKQNTWLSDSGRKAAIKKMTVAHLQLVKPSNDGEWDFNPKAPYSIKTPYANRKLLHMNLTKKKIEELKKKRNKMRWEMGPLTVNAYYSPPDNKFVLPMGILQYPFFDAKLSDKANLGAVGAVIGHELGHGIDDEGSRYDETGKFHEWFTPGDLTEFKKRGQKLVEQFNKIGHNGQLTLGENIGDLVGITFAYRAAFPDNKGTLEDKQNFFLQFGRVWCNVMRPKLRENMLKTNPHSLGEARVNQQMKNQPGFTEAYSCKAGDGLYLEPDDRAQIW
jgi:putative endopeptidase